MREDVGVSHIYPNKASRVKKELSFDQKWAKIDALLIRADFEDDKLSPSD